ncbi:MAG: hypothetical protein ACI9FN_003433, partial [Saprospiraceae bacterium]
GAHDIFYEDVFHSILIEDLFESILTHSQRIKND